MENVLEPLFTNVVVKLVDNHYRKTKTDSGLILPTGSYKSAETGDIENDLEEVICLAKVIAAGDSVKYVKPEDEVYVDIRSIRPIPYKGLKYGVLNEQNILTIVRE